MFKTRLMSGIVLVLAAIVVLVLGNWWLLATVFALSTVGIFELLRACGLEKEPLAFVAYIGNVGYYLVVSLDHGNDDPRSDFHVDRICAQLSEV